MDYTDRQWFGMIFGSQTAQRLTRFQLFNLPDRRFKSWSLNSDFLFLLFLHKSGVRLVFCCCFVLFRFFYFSDSGLVHLCHFHLLIN